MKSFQDLEAGGGTFTSRRRDSINGKQDPIQAVIKSDVFQINKSLAAFKRLVIYDLGTPKDTHQLRQKLRSTRLHIAQLVKDTSAKLKQASDIDQCIEVGARKKIADDACQLAKDFKSVVKEFQEAQLVAAEKERNSMPLCFTLGVFKLHYKQDGQKLDENNVPEQRTTLMESRRQEVLLLNNEIVFNEEIIEERERGIKEIQNQIDEVHEIFKHLAALVHEQGDAIHHIDSNVNKSHTAIEQGKSQLEKAAKTQNQIHV
ncbi:hypothetical protein MKW92_013243 [Papaver armeniacum]|nr:hypothetical protein MKW92_013243 [Papaver armeniacum]